MIYTLDCQNISEALVSKATSAQRARYLLDKALELRGLSYLEAGELLNVKDAAMEQSVFDTAGKVKEKIYGKRVVLFAPLYLSNECSNNCLYCGFRKDNLSLPRRTLSAGEAAEEAKKIEGMGHKRVLLVCGEKGKSNGANYVAEAISKIYDNTDIRRINVNIAPLSTEEFRTLKGVGIGTYQAFQETYHPEAFAYYHPSGSKADLNRRLTVFDKALEAGIDDYGMGVLFGLYDYRFEVMALIWHASMLEQRWGVGPHTVSVPRLKKAEGSKVSETVFQVSDQQLMMVTAVLRLALPYTGIILSTREEAALRDQLLKLGVSQISAGSSTAPGGYGGAAEKGGTQFSLEDGRTLDEVVRDICKAGYLPSFCTACYRQERTGEKFMALAKTGDIRKLCQPNALLTFKEYLKDYALEETAVEGERALEKFLKCEDVKGVTGSLTERLDLIQKGHRDLYY